MFAKAATTGLLYTCVIHPHASDPSVCMLMPSVEVIVVGFGLVLTRTEVTRTDLQGATVRTRVRMLSSC